MSFKITPSTRTKLNPQNIICNNLIATGYCMSGQHCRHKHLPELMVNINKQILTRSDNFNSSLQDSNFNWDILENSNNDKEALSMITHFYNNTVNKNMTILDDNQFVYNIVTKNKRLPIFLKLSQKK
jgi:hypothetical protein